MNTKNNQRAKDTRQRIENIFISILKNVKLHKISVQEICRQSGINRSTFYSHYTDVYDLMDKIETNMSRNICKFFTDEETGHYKTLSAECFVGLFQFIKDNSEFYHAYLSSNGGKNMISVPISESDRKRFEPTFQASGILSDIEMEYHLNFFKAGLNAIIRLWLDTNCHETPKELVDIISREYTPRKELFS